MNTALLVCDHVLPQFQNDHGTYPEMFNNLFPEIDLVSHFVCDGDFPNVEDYDAYVISGSKLSVYDDIPWIKELIEFTKSAHQSEKKILGVCFGHQMIAEALGGKVEKSDAGFLIGVHEFEILVQESWMVPYKSPFNMLMLCQDQVLKLPSNSRILAKSGSCPIAIFEVGDKVLGIQGHPEFTKEYNKAVFESRLGKIGQDKIDQAIASFANEPDSRLLQRHLTAFLSRD